MNIKLPEAVRALATELAELPSIGPRQSVRLAFYLIGKGPAYIANLAGDIAALEKIKICARCFFIHQNANTLCDICNTTARNQSIIMLVEKETDVISIENTKKFSGRYLVLGPIPKTGVLEE